MWTCLWSCIWLGELVAHISFLIIGLQIIRYYSVSMLNFADYLAFHFIGFFRKVSQKCFLFTKLLHLNFLSVWVFCSPISAQIQVEQNSITAYFMIYWPVVVLVSKNWSPYLPSTTCRLCMICFRTEYQINVKWMCICFQRADWPCS